MAELLPFLLTFQYSLLDVFHRGENAFMILLRCKQFQVFFFGDFYVDAETVGVKSGFVYQFATGTGNAFQVDIPVETVHQAQVFGDTHESFHGIVRIADNAGTEEQAFDIIATVKFHSQLYQFRYGKRGAREVVAAAVHAVGTIVDTIIGKHDFQQ